MDGDHLALPVLVAMEWRRGMVHVFVDDENTASGQRHLSQAGHGAVLTSLPGKTHPIPLLHWPVERSLHWEGFPPGGVMVPHLARGWPCGWLPRGPEWRKRVGLPVAKGWWEWKAWTYWERAERVLKYVAECSGVKKMCCFMEMSREKPNLTTSKSKAERIEGIHDPPLDRVLSGWDMCLSSFERLSLYGEMSCNGLMVSKSKV